LVSCLCRHSAKQNNLIFCSKKRSSFQTLQCAICILAS
jgi:hypothetical protein